MLNSVCGEYRHKLKSHVLRPIGVTKSFSAPVSVACLRRTSSRDLMTEKIEAYETVQRK
jgi:hypothetical protein